MADLVDCSPELACLRLEALYRHDHRGRLVSVNEWNGGAAPRFHLKRTVKRHFGRYRADLADDLVERLEELRAREPIGRRQAKWPGLHSQYLKLLTLHGPVVRVCTTMWPSLKVGDQARPNLKISQRLMFFLGSHQIQRRLRCPPR
jgi:hypothetical protein